MRGVSRLEERNFQCCPHYITTHNPISWSQNHETNSLRPPQHFVFNIKFLLIFFSLASNARRKPFRRMCINLIFFVFNYSPCHWVLPSLTSNWCRVLPLFHISRTLQSSFFEVSMKLTFRSHADCLGISTMSITELGKMCEKHNWQSERNNKMQE